MLKLAMLFIKDKKPKLNTQSDSKANWKKGKLVVLKEEGSRGRRRRRRRRRRKRRRRRRRSKVACGCIN